MAEQHAGIHLRWVCLFLGCVLMLLALARVDQIQLAQSASDRLQALTERRDKLRVHLLHLSLERKVLLSPLILEKAADTRLNLATRPPARIQPLPLPPAAQNPITQLAKESR